MICELQSRLKRCYGFDLIGIPPKRAGVAQLVERVLAKHEVVGSKPITRFLKDSQFCAES